MILCSNSCFFLIYSIYREKWKKVPYPAFPLWSISTLDGVEVVRVGAWIQMFVYVQVSALLWTSLTITISGFLCVFIFKAWVREKDKSTIHHMMGPGQNQDLTHEGMTSTHWIIYLIWSSLLNPICTTVTVFPRKNVTPLMFWQTDQELKL